MCFVANCGRDAEDFEAKKGKGGCFSVLTYLYMCVPAAGEVPFWYRVPLAGVIGWRFAASRFCPYPFPPISSAVVSFYSTAVCFAFGRLAVAVVSFVCYFVWRWIFLRVCHTATLPLPLVSF